MLTPQLAWGHRGHSNPAPWDACVEHTLGESCQWNDAHGAAYRGTCRSMSEHLLCVRNQPIEPAAPALVSEPGPSSPEPEPHPHPRPLVGGWLWAAALGLLVGVVWRRRPKG
ncbi:MAG: hypothetical protein AAGF11_08960 [Myxococcota bacterium]